MRCKRSRKKLSRALSALADAQDELVRKERLASIGQLTKGLVDRILNPLNYINNFAHLSAVLAKDIKQNIDEDEETGKHDNYNDTQELLVLLTSNLDKIAKHGDNTVPDRKSDGRIAERSFGESNLRGY